MNQDHDKKVTFIYFMLGLIITIGVVMIFLLTSCTLSFNNVMTEGVASDVVDSDPSTRATTTVPISGL